MFSPLKDVVHLSLFIIIYYSEWWVVRLFDDTGRCLYPDSFHLYSNEVCVGSSEGKHAALCLPFASDELARLPPTHDTTLLNFNILETILQLIVLGAAVLVVTRFISSKSGQMSDGSFEGVIHFSSAFLLFAAVVFVSVAPTADSKQWADGFLTCSVIVKPGAGYALAVLAIPLEVHLALVRTRQKPIAFGLPYTSHIGLGAD